MEINKHNKSEGVKVIRAVFDQQTITVYKAFNKAIAGSAVKNQTFVSPPFKIDRMTWIKPSFLWMMYRSGWGTKENQEHILAIKIKRDGFEWALKNSCLSHFDGRTYSSHEAWKEKLHNSPVRIQWDPEKDINLNPQPLKSIQIGLSGTAVEQYINNWIVEVEDITETCTAIKQLLSMNDIAGAAALLPKEAQYPLTRKLQQITGAADS
jgi:hypothetical protein